jgi:hypothetical protein
VLKEPLNATSLIIFRVMLDVKDAKLHTGERRPCPLSVTAYSLHSYQPFMSSKGLHLQQKPEGVSRCGDKASFNGDLFLTIYLFS